MLFLELCAAKTIVQAALVRGISAIGASAHKLLVSLHAKIKATRGATVKLPAVAAIIYQSKSSLHFDNIIRNYMEFRDNC